MIKRLLVLLIVSTNTMMNNNCSCEEYDHNLTIDLNKHSIVDYIDYLEWRNIMIEEYGQKVYEEQNLDFDIESEDESMEDYLENIRE